MIKLWQKNTGTADAVEKFTVGNDRELDMNLASFDVLGSLAHTRMLETIGLLSKEELASIQLELKLIYKDIINNKFTLDEGVEDIHSQIEIALTKKLGDAGKKIHSARSRNDQVLVDLKMFMRHELMSIVSVVKDLFELLLQKSEENKEHFLPGYTHLQLAMPSSFGLWFGAYAESLCDDLLPLEAAYRIVNKNPLGSAAGYGSSFPINRKLTTELLGFDDMHHNVVYAQMSRGKTERIAASALASIAATLAKLSMDACLFMNQNFAFISFPDELTTGSSIMPHKKNPDVFELIRAHCNRIQALPNEISMITVNLPSGYHRDLQLLKEHLVPAFNDLRNCIQMTKLMLENIKINGHIIDDPKYLSLFTVEEVNKLVLQGVPFRDAYQQIGTLVNDGSFKSNKILNHTHEGSAGNLMNNEIRSNFFRTLSNFNFSKVEAALEELLQ